MEGTTSTQNANRRIARAAITIMAAFILSSLVGILQNTVMTNAFGTSPDFDSFNSANRITEVLFNLVAGGALASAFIPTFTGFLTKKDNEGAWHLASSIINLVLLILIFCSVLATIFARQVVRYGLYTLAPGVQVTQFDLTVRLLQEMMPSVAIFGVSGLIMGILNANQVFLIPALAPSMFSIGLIFGTWFLVPTMGIDGLAWGTVLGATLHLLVQIPSLFKLKGRRFFFSLGLHNAAVKEVIVLMLPRLLGVAFVQINFIINTMIANSLPVGSVSAITLAFQFMLMPEYTIAQSIAIASLPTFSEQVTRNRRDEMRSSLASALRSMLFLAIPASIGLILLRRPLIVFLYQHGEFNAHSTDLVSWALLFYAAGLFGHCVVEITSRAFYALHDTRTPVIVGVIAMCINIGLSLVFSNLFSQWGWLPLGGLALANSVATALEMTAHLIIMRHRMQGLDGKKMGISLAYTLFGTLIMGAVVYGWMVLARNQRPVLIALGGAALGCGVYLVVGFILRNPEVASVIGMFKRRFSR